MNIVFIHKGNSDYMKISLRQARKMNKSAKIYLIGDENNNKYDFLEHYNINNYSENTKLNEFNKYYKHLSPNSFEYEKFCFNRWFILLNFMKENNISHCFHADTDVMILKEILDDNFKENFCYCYDSGHSAYFSISELENLCDFIINYYRDEDKLYELNNIYETKKRNKVKEGISDMTLITLYAKTNKQKVIDLSEIREKSIFDHNINCGDGYQILGDKKKIIVKNKELYATNLKNNENIKLNTLHFQGVAKRFISYFEYENLPKDDCEYIFNYSTLKWERDINFKMTINSKMKNISYKIKNKIITIKNLYIENN